MVYPHDGKCRVGTIGVGGYDGDGVVAADRVVEGQECGVEGDGAVEQGAVPCIGKSVGIAFAEQDFHL